MKRFFDFVSPRPGGDEVRDDDVERVVAPGEEEEHDGGQGVEERQPVEDEEGGWSVWGEIGKLRRLLFERNVGGINKDPNIKTLSYIVS